VTKRHSLVFLLEIMLSILLFALVSGVCLRLFVHSHSLSQEAGDLDFAVSQTSSVAELVRHSASLSDALDLVGREYGAEPEADALTIYFSQDHQVSNQQTGCYVLTIQAFPQDLVCYDISLKRMGQTDAIYTLTTEVYYGAK
jgi:hypothetical protein